MSTQENDSITGGESERLERAHRIFVSQILNQLVQAGDAIHGGVVTPITSNGEGTVFTITRGFSDDLTVQITAVLRIMKPGDVI